MYVCFPTPSFLRSAIPLRLGRDVDQCLIAFSPINGIDLDLGDFYGCNCVADNWLPVPTSSVFISQSGLGGPGYWFVFLQPTTPLSKQIGSPEVLSREFRAPVETMALTWSNIIVVVPSAKSLLPPLVKRPFKTTAAAMLSQPCIHQAPTSRTLVWDGPIRLLSPELAVRRKCHPSLRCQLHTLTPLYAQHFAWWFPRGS